MYTYVLNLQMAMPLSASTLDWITAISTSFAAVGTVVAAAIAMYSARQSAKSALDSKRSSQASLMPIIEPSSIILSAVARSYPNYIEVNFKNVGKGLAQNIQINIPDLSFSKKLSRSVNPDGAISWTRSLEDTNNAERWNASRGKDLAMNITYTDIFGNEIITRSSVLLDDHTFHLEDFIWTVEYVNR